MQTFTALETDLPKLSEALRRFRISRLCAKSGAPDSPTLPAYLSEVTRLEWRELFDRDPEQMDLADFPLVRALADDFRAEDASKAAGAAIDLVMQSIK